MKAEFFEWYVPFFIISLGASIVKRPVCQVIGVVPKLLYPYLYALPIALLYKQVYNVATRIYTNKWSLKREIKLGFVDNLSGEFVAA